MGTGYDISASSSTSQNATSGISAPFSVTGGGGAPLTTLLTQGANSTANTSATASIPWLTYAIIGGVVLLAIFLWKQFRK
jgi:hypothetical protein